MRMIALFSLAVALTASGCQAWRSVSGEARPEENGTEATGRTSAIYAAVIRQLVTKDVYLRQRPPFERIFVVRTRGARYFETESPPRPFSSAVARGVLEALRDLPVRLVAHPDTVLVDHRPCGGFVVRRGGVLIGVGPVRRAQGDAVTVVTWVVSGCLGKNGQRLTYVLEPADEGWRVVRTRDPVIA